MSLSFPGLARAARPQRGVRIRRTACALLTAASALLQNGCSSGPETTAADVAIVELTGPVQAVRVGTTVAIGVRLRDAQGQPVENVAVAWSSSDPAVATVSNSGVVTATGTGTARIAASALGRSASVMITVAEREVASVQVTPASVTVRVAATVSLAAVPLDGDGNALQGRAVLWTTGNATIATVNSAGVVTGVAPGGTTVTATSEGRTGSAAVTVTLTPVATVTVTPPSITLGVSTEAALTASPRDAAGAALTGRAVSWSSSNVEVATVSTTGVVTALAPGSVTITATSEGRQGSATVVVQQRLASTVTLTPASPSIVAGSTVQLGAQVTDASGNVITGRPIAYSSDATAVATVTAAGLVTGVSPGTARITATVDGKTGTATVTVTPVPVATVQVTPATVTLAPGATSQLTAAARAADGTVLTGRTVTWTSGAPAIATVSASGLVTAVGPGVVTVFATIDGVLGSASVTVQGGPAVASVSVVATLSSIPVGGTSQLTATPRDAAGAALTGRSVAWTTSNENIAFVSSTGLVVGVAPGTVTISATSEGVRGSTVITVR